MIFREAYVIHVLKDQVTNVNETMKTPQYLSIRKDKLKWSSEAIPIGFELDLKTISIHVLGGDEIDHVSKKYPHNAEDWVEGITANASNAFHVSDINIDFALV